FGSTHPSNNSSTPPPRITDVFVSLSKSAAYFLRMSRIIGQVGHSESAVSLNVDRDTVVRSPIVPPQPWHRRFSVSDPESELGSDSDSASESRSRSDCAPS